jgi:hypothetical protein
VLDLPDLRLTVAHPDHPPLVRVLPSVPLTELELVLERGLAVAVSIVDERGGLLDGGSLSVRTSDGAQTGVVASTAPGRFLVRGLRSAPHQFVLSIGGTSELRVHEAHEPELVFRMPEMGAVEARWDLARTAETSDFLWLELRAAPDGRVAMQQGFHDTPAGEQRFDPVQPGTYEAVLKVENEAGEIVLARAPVTVVPGETAQVALPPR